MKRELIFALPTTYTEELKAQSQELTPGLYLLPEAKEWQEAAENVLFAQRRETLESDNSARQLNPYNIPRYWDDVRGEFVYFPYKRVEGSGESELLNKVSIGYCGHVDFIDGQEGESSIVTIPSLIANNLGRETIEESTIIHIGTLPLHGHGAQATLAVTELAKRAIIITSGKVEDRHIGLIVVSETQPGHRVVAKEAGLFAMSPMTAAELLVLDGIVLEDWTRIFLENLQPQDLQQRDPEAPVMGMIPVSYYGSWCNEMAFVKKIISSPDSDFEMFEGEEPLEAVSRILAEHVTNGLIMNCVFGRKLISLCAVTVFHNHGQPMLDIAARPDEKAVLIDCDQTQRLADVAPATAAVSASLFTDENGIQHMPSVGFFTEYLRQLMVKLMNSPLKLEFLRFLSNTHETEMNRQRRVQAAAPQEKTTGNIQVPAGKTPAGIPKALLDRMAAANNT